MNGQPGLKLSDFKQVYLASLIMEVPVNSTLVKNSLLKIDHFCMKICNNQKPGKAQLRMSG